MTPVGTFTSIAADDTIEIYNGVDFTNLLRSYGNSVSTTGVRPHGDKTTSIAVGAGVRAKFCRHTCPGNHVNSFDVVGPYNINDLDEMDNTISNLVTNPYDESDLTDARVQLFGKADYACPYCGVFAVGEYLTADLYSNHIGNPGTTYAAKGIKVPSRMTARVYPQDNYGGQEFVFDGPVTLQFADDN